LLADDSEEFRRAIRRLLDSQSEISLVGAATDFSEAVLFAALLRPDIVLLDLRMKDSQGLDALGASPQIISTGSTIIAISFSVDGDAKALARKTYLRYRVFSLGGGQEYCGFPAIGYLRMSDDARQLAEL
jgi:chemotaxis response regulator CheB